MANTTVLLYTTNPFNKLKKKQPANYANQKCNESYWSLAYTLTWTSLNRSKPQKTKGFVKNDNNRKLRHHPKIIVKTRKTHGAANFRKTWVKPSNIP